VKVLEKYQLVLVFADHRVPELAGLKLGDALRLLGLPSL
jgi:hypothetical protein